MRNQKYEKEAARLMGLVAHAMEDQGITQAELSRRSGFGRPYISRLFKKDGDKRVASLSTALRLSNALGLLAITAKKET